MSRCVLFTDIRSLHIRLDVSFIRCLLSEITLFLQSKISVSF